MTTEARERLDVDVLFIGAGVANLCAAYKLTQSVKAYNAEAKTCGKPVIKDPVIVVIEKGKELGSHSLSGAIVDPIAFKELFPDIPVAEFPFKAAVEREKVMMLFKKSKIGIPGIALPKAMRNKGLYLASVGEIVKWLAKKCTEQGIEIYTEFAVNELIKDDKRIVGAKIADKKVDAEGKPLEGYTPGMDVYAKVTVLGEGTHGYLSQKLISEYNLSEGANPQVWGLGLKELIEIPAGRIKKGTIFHTLGYPIGNKMYGGSFLYYLSETQVAIGQIFGLDYPDPMFSSHEALLRLKKHPFVAKLLAGGKVTSYGAKTMPDGGWFSLPKLSVDGAVLVGDSAGFLNALRLKGIHLAAKSGILAAERICSALAINDFSARFLNYKVEFEESWAGKELRRARNFRQGFHRGLFIGLFFAGMSKFTLSILPAGRMRLLSDFKSLIKLVPGKKPVTVKKQNTDRELNLDIETDVFLSGTLHDEHQPPHCRILRTEDCFRCREEYFMPCTRFCPTKVYEEKLDPQGNFTGIQVSFSNCVHCKTCAIKDPFENIEWVPPQGGDGPHYKSM